MATVAIPSSRRSSVDTRRLELFRPDNRFTLDDISDLHDLADELAGRVVPGVRMTEAEFESWCDADVRAEWIDGEVVLMSPESIDQITLAGFLYRVLCDLVEDRDCGQVIGRDFIVRLPKQKRRRAPDLMFARKDKLHLIRPTYFDGAPDLIIEIVSPDSQSRDFREKFNEYQRAGVKEYWVFDPATGRVEAYSLAKSRKYERMIDTDDWIKSAVIPGFALKQSWLTCAELPRPAVALREMAARKHHPTRRNGAK